MKAAEDPVEKGGEHLRQNKAREEGRMRMVVENVKGTACAPAPPSSILDRSITGIFPWGYVSTRRRVKQKLGGVVQSPRSSG